MQKNTLAIVIPYYKIGYFEELLSALVNQTNKNFNVYIGDDFSPDSPVELIGNYKDKLNIEYKKFEKNLGGISLTKQWERCIEMIGNEAWVWVLPDDDLPSENCVEAFYEALPNAEQNNVKVFRLPLKIIDDQSVITNDLKNDDPVIENNLEFYSRIVKGKATSTLGDNIFHTKSLAQSGGFVDFPKAWGSDHATVLNVSNGGNLYYLKNAVLNFRMSGENISSDTTDGVEKMESRIQFFKWLKNNENIFPHKPDSEFYKFFYWKGEYYVLNEWKFSFSLLKQLYTLRKICFNSSSILPMVKVVLQKIGLLKK